MESSEVKFKFPVIKFSSRGKKQPRSLVMTTKSIQNVAGNSVQWERPVQEIHGIHTSSKEPRSFAISFLTTYRFNADSEEQVNSIVEAFRRLELGKSFRDDDVIDYMLLPEAKRATFVKKGQKYEDDDEDDEDAAGEPAGARSRAPLHALKTNLQDINDTDNGIDYVESLANYAVNNTIVGAKTSDLKENPLVLYRFTRPARFPSPPESHQKLMRPQNFELVSTIGKGSFGKVFLVRRVDDNRFFAMKVLKKRAVLDRRQLDHLHAEHTILQSFTHPNMVKLYHSFQTRTRIFLITNFAIGGELFHHLKKVGRFPEQLAVFYLAQLILILNYLHDYDCVFRDTKPENLLLDAAGNILLTDFGLSKVGISADSSSSNGQVTHSFCGTPDYLSGEVISGVPHGKSVDIWSLGALLFEMLVGNAPFSFAVPSAQASGGNARSELYRRILKGVVVYPNFVSAEARDFISQCLNRRPKDRPSFGEIREHSLFRKNGIDFDRLYRREIPPPFKPKIDPVCVQAVEGKLIKNPNDVVYKFVSPENLVSNFDSRFTSEPPTLQSSTPNDGVSVEEDRLFREFAWTAQDAFNPI